MRIDYCPKCKKAGLKYERIPTLAYQNDTRTEDEVNEYRIEHLRGNKWCPRCKEWVNPECHEWSRS